MRLPRFVQREWSWHTPRWFVSVACLGQWGSARGEQSSRVESLTEWYASITEYDHGSFGQGQRGSGQNQGDFVRFLTTATSGRSAIWCFCSNAGRVAHLLGIWQALDNGVLVPDVRGSASAGRHNDSEDSCQGWNPVLGNPPTILSLLNPDTKKRIRLLDIQNYGLDPLPDSAPLKHTVDYIERSITDIADEVRMRKLGGFSCTASSQIWKGWRSDYMPIRPAIHNCSGAIGLEMEALHGGRCEVYRYGLVNGPVYHVDFRSQYPSVCRDTLLPCRLVGYKQRSRSGEFAGKLSQWACICSVLLETDEPLYPHRYKGELVFPVGRFRTTLCGSELQLALENGHVRKTGRLAWYGKGFVLQDIMESMLECRANASADGRRGTVQFAKRAANSLIGCFARRNISWASVSGRTNGPRWGTWFQSDDYSNSTKYRSIAGFVEREVDYGFSDWSFPAISAWVYSEARMRLLGAIKASGWSSVYYADTDSMFGSESVCAGLSPSQRAGNADPGLLRLCNTYNTVELLGRKHYKVDGRLVCAGIPLMRERGGRSSSFVGVNESVMGALSHLRMPANLEMDVDYSGCLEAPIGRLGSGGRVSPIEIWEK